VQARRRVRKKPKTLFDAVVVAVDDLGGKLSAENAVTLPALKKHLTASRGLDFAKTAAKNKLKKALEKAISEGKLVKEGSSYMLPAGELSRKDLEEAWRQQKIVLPIEECWEGGGYTGNCERGENDKLVIELECCYFNGFEEDEEGEKMMPDGWAEMSTDEKESWASGVLSTGQSDFQGRISIPQNLREEGRGYVFEFIHPRPNGGNVAQGRICFCDHGNR
jgi:hypothetical protein